jgi:hypothetical protein
MPSYDTNWTIRIFFEIEVGQLAKPSFVVHFFTQTTMSTHASTFAFGEYTITQIPSQVKPTLLPKGPELFLSGFRVDGKDFHVTITRKGEIFCGNVLITQDGGLPPESIITGDFIVQEIRRKFGLND